MVEQSFPNPEPLPEERPPARIQFALPFHEPWLTKVILILNTLLFVLLSLQSSKGFLEAVLNGTTTQSLILFGAKYNQLIIEGQYWRLVTPIFLHIGLMHLLFNQYALHLFGREIESLFGTPRFGAIYLLTGMFGSLASFVASNAVSAGASGAIFGIIGAMVAFLLRHRETLGQKGREHFRGLLGMIALNIFLGVTIPGIDNYGHMGGLISGLILGGILSPTYALQQQPDPPFIQLVERPPLLSTTLVLFVTIAILIFGTMLAIPIAPTN